MEKIEICDDFDLHIFRDLWAWDNAWPEYKTPGEAVRALKDGNIPGYIYRMD